MNDTQKRFDIAEGLIKDPSFRQNKGLGNEVGYYVFDYPARDELEVRERIKFWEKKNKPLIDGFELKVFDLYDIMIDILEAEGFLEQCFMFEKKHGMNRLEAAIGRTLKLSDDSGGIIADYIRDHTPENAVVFLMGVGKCYPVLRSHKVLNNLHQVFDSVPVVLFYPGKYSGEGLILFDDIDDGNYYRAFKLVN